jgi:hypothetical protein
MDYRYLTRRTARQIRCETTRVFFTVFVQTFDLFQLVRLWWFTVFIVTLYWRLVYHQLTHFELTHLTYL